MASSGLTSTVATVGGGGRRGATVPYGGWVDGVFTDGSPVPILFANVAVAAIATLWSREASTMVGFKDSHLGQATI